MFDKKTFLRKDGSKPQNDAEWAFEELKALAAEDFHSDPESPNCPYCWPESGMFGKTTDLECHYCEGTGIHPSTPYADDGTQCPECGIPLAHIPREDLAYCENCNFTIYDYNA